MLMVVTARTRDGSAGISAGVVTDDLRVGTFDCNHSSPSSSSNRLLSIFRWHLIVVWSQWLAAGLFDSKISIFFVQYYSIVVPPFG